MWDRMTFAIMAMVVATVANATTAYPDEIETHSAVIENRNHRDRSEEPARSRCWPRLRRLARVSRKGSPP